MFLFLSLCFVADCVSGPFVLRLTCSIVLHVVLYVLLTVCFCVCFALLFSSLSCLPVCVCDSRVFVLCVMLFFVFV